MLAYNVWLAEPDLDRARDDRPLASRAPAVRALAFPVGDTVQVSMNLIAPSEVGPEVVYDAIAAVLHRSRRAELVGLVPDAVRAAIDPRTLGGARPGRGQNDRSPTRGEPPRSGLI